MEKSQRKAEQEEEKKSLSYEQAKVVRDKMNGALFTCGVGGNARHALIVHPPPPPPPTKDFAESLKMTEKRCPNLTW